MLQATDKEHACPSCSVPWIEHLGIQGTCHKLQEARRLIGHLEKELDQWRTAAEVEADLGDEARAELARLRPPADDAEPVTEEWLRSVGFGACWGYPLRLQGPELDVVCTPHEELGAAYRTDFFPTCDMPTRGDVRALCRALGVPLTEGR